MKTKLAVCVIVVSLLSSARAAEQKLPQPKIAFNADDVAWLEQECVRLLKACQIRAEDGTVLYTPDGFGNYRALWTRDFAYMVENAGDLIPREHIREGILYLLKGQRQDGCIPDRVQADGRAVYSAGPPESPVGDVPTDNSPFMVKLVADYVALTGDLELFRLVSDQLDRAMDFTRRSPEGLVYIPPGHAQSPYGFTDTVAKTGNLLFDSLLYWDASRLHAELHTKTGGQARAVEYRRRAKLIERQLSLLRDKSTGLYFAASADCRQLDVWGNAYALYIGFPMVEPEKVRRYLLANLQCFTWRGQVRHLLQGQYWPKTLIPVERDTYQNGAYWGTASGWVLAAIQPLDPKRASVLFSDLIAFYREKRTPECAGPNYLKLPDYVASAVNPRGAGRRVLGRAKTYLSQSH